MRDTPIHADTAELENECQRHRILTSSSDAVCLAAGCLQYADVFITYRSTPVGWYSDDNYSPTSSGDIVLLARGRAMGERLGQGGKRSPTHAPDAGYNLLEGATGWMGQRAALANP